jgi:hypothetical protein
MEALDCDTAIPTICTIHLKLFSPVPTSLSVGIASRPKLGRHLAYFVATIAENSLVKIGRIPLPSINPKVPQHESPIVHPTRPDIAPRNRASPTFNDVVPLHSRLAA